MITVKELAIPDVKLLMPKLHRDDRGHLIETLHEKQMQDAGLISSFVQENQTFSKHTFTIRGLHGQRPPHAQAKLVRVLSGRIFDVAVDARPNSPTYGQHVSAILTPDEAMQLLVPAGFLHGFCTLEDNTTVLYKMSSLYAPGSEVGVIWNDPDLNIAWPTDVKRAIISDKDAALPRFKDFPRIEWAGAA